MTRLSIFLFICMFLFPPSTSDTYEQSPSIVLVQELPQALSVFPDYDYLFDPMLSDENQLVWNFSVFDMSNSSNITNLSNFMFIAF
jgi:hypothetical protein